MNEVAKQAVDLRPLFMFSARSWSRLAGVRPELVALAQSALVVSDVDFGISEGVRAIDRQRTLVAEGASWTMNSRHLTGHAIDVFAWVDGRAAWDPPYYRSIYNAFENARDITGISFRWGGDFDGDGIIDDADLCHFQLPWADYPADVEHELAAEHEFAAELVLVPDVRECA